MSYLNQNDIAFNQSMRARVAQCAAGENVDTPDVWAGEHCREWAAAPGWDAAWESAEVSHPPDPESMEPPYDPGADEAVITDAMILSQVQSML